MEIYDIVMLAVIAGATLLGFVKGLVWQIASIASLILSYFLALRFSEQLAPVFGQQPPWNRFLAMLAIYIGTSFVIWMACRFVKSALDSVQLSSFDRQLGGVFGAAKGALLCVCITFFAVTLNSQTRDHVLQSRSGHYIAAFLDKADGIMPPELHAYLDPYLNRLEQELQPVREDNQPANAMNNTWGWQR